METLDVVRVRSEWEGRKRLRGCEAERLGGDRKVGMGVGGRSMLRGESPAVYLGAPELRPAVGLRGGIGNRENYGNAA